MIAYVASGCADLNRTTDAIRTTDLIRATALDYSIEALMHAVRHTLTNLSTRINVRDLNKRQSTCHWVSLAKTQPVCEQV